MRPKAPCARRSRSLSENSHRGEGKPARVRFFGYLMKYLFPLIVASLLVAIATAMLEQGPLTLPFLAGYLSGIVVPLVVFSGILTLVAAGVYRLFKGRDMPNPAIAVWGIWALVALYNFYGNYQRIMDRQAAQVRQAAVEGMVDLSVERTAENTLPQPQDGKDETGKSSEALALQARFARDFQQLDAELAGKVAAIRIPPLMEPAFLKDKWRFPEAVQQLEYYGQLFRQHKERHARLVSQMRAEIEQLDLPEKEKLQAIHEFENTYGIDGILSGKYFDIVVEVAEQGIAYLDFLERARYRVSNGQVAFETDTETERFRDFLLNFKRLSEREVATQRELADSRKQRVARLRELSR